MPSDADAVVDASVVVDYVLGGSAAAAIGSRIEGLVLLAPAHIDSEILSAFGRMNRAGELTARATGEMLEDAMAIPLQRTPVADLVLGAWRQRDRYRLADALYVELAEREGLPLLTTDGPLSRAASVAELVQP